MKKNKLIIGIAIALMLIVGGVFVLIVGGVVVFHPIQPKEPMPILETEERIEEQREVYYGWSTYGQCQRDNDCFVSGCNTEICQGRVEEPRVTICILPDKPTPKQLNYGCQCVNQKCQWSK